MLAALGPDDPKTHTVARNLASTQLSAPSSPGSLPGKTQLDASQRPASPTREVRATPPHRHTAAPPHPILITSSSSPHAVACREGGEGAGFGGAARAAHAARCARAAAGAGERPAARRASHPAAEPQTCCRRRGRRALRRRLRHASGDLLESEPRGADRGRRLARCRWQWPVDATQLRAAEHLARTFVL